jgi:hypothetical protein
MDRYIKKEWVEALRGGKYKQYRGLLRQGDRYSPLGVLCAIAIDYEVIPEVPETKELPREVEDWSELDWFDIEDLERLNDAGASFDKIASWISRNVPAW